ncbi:MAG TPA: hypothetical protein VKN99_11395 [Polyangia bacterium]|nr:hypothetical protein [Polyangia bacterium]
MASWLFQYGGEEAQHEVYDALPVRARFALQRDAPMLGIVPKGWYSTAAATALVAGAERRAAPAERELYLRDLGTHIMREGINVFYRSLFKLFVSPRSLIENAETAWQRYYSEGDVEAGMTGRGRALVSFLNWQGHTRALCEVGGYSALHLLENVGAREPRVRWLHCLEDGAPERCQWEYSWQE